jgi:hypothetical protein
VQIDGSTRASDQVTDYELRAPRFERTSTPLQRRHLGQGPHREGTLNGNGTETCGGRAARVFQGRYYGEGSPLTAPAEGYGQIRQTPSLRRFIQLAQMALEPGDPVSFAPYYSIRR